MATIGFLTDTDTITYVNKVATDAGEQFDASDEDIVKHAMDRAYKAIRGILAGRCLTASQTLLWEDGANAQRSLTIFFAFLDLYTGKSRGLPEWLDRYDVRDDVKKATILDSDGNILASGEDVSFVQVIDLVQANEDLEDSEVRDITLEGE